jgi:hypothetical protein
MCYYIALNVESSTTSCHEVRPIDGLFQPPPEWLVTQETSIYNEASRNFLSVEHVEWDSCLFPYDQT